MRNAELHAIEVVTLFVADLAASRAFYDAVFGAEVVYADPVSTVLRFGPLMVNLLAAPEAPGLVEPMAAGAPGGSASFVFTIRVEDVDAVARDLEARGATLLNGPADRPWGRRTAAFADPDGFVWEIAQELG